MNYSFKQLENFVAVAEAGSIRAAARGLNVSQPAVTKSVRSLELALNTQLVQRTTQGVALTPVGSAFLLRVRVAQSELRKGREEIATSGSTGTVAFGVGPVAAVSIAPQAVARFHKESPGVLIRVVEGFPPALLPLVREGTLDFAIGPRLDKAIDPALSFRPLFQEEFAVVCRKRHPAARARSLAQLVDTEWVDLWRSGLPNGPLDRAFTAAGLTLPRVLVRCESFNIAASVVANTDMLALLSRRLLNLPLARESLQEIPIKERHPHLTVGIFARSNPPLTRQSANLARVVASEAKGLARSFR